jgi:hypothetical protein
MQIRRLLNFLGTINRYLIRIRKSALFLTASVRGEVVFGGKNEPGLQEQMGLWFAGRQSALSPQKPGQTGRHCRLNLSQYSASGQSELVVQSRKHHKPDVIKIS